MKGLGFEHYIKICVVGDPFVGKTWLLHSLVHHKTPENPGPTLFDNLSTQLVVEGEEYELSLWDASGHPQHRKMRALSYTDADVILLCYSVDDRISYDNIRLRWLPELRRYATGIPRILVGLKSDTRGQNRQGQRAINLPPVSQEEGEFLQFHIQAASFFETSSILCPKQLPALFTSVVKTALYSRRHRASKGSCCLQ